MNNPKNEELERIQDESQELYKIWKREEHTRLREAFEKKKLNPAGYDFDAYNQAIDDCLSELHSKEDK